MEYDKKIRAIDAECRANTVTIIALLADFAYNRDDEDINRVCFILGKAEFAANVIDIVRPEPGKPPYVHFTCIKTSEIELVVKAHKIRTRIEIGRQLREIRNTQHLTLKDVALRACTHEATILKLEKGKWSASVDLLQKVCDALNCEIIVKGK